MRQMTQKNNAVPVVDSEDLCLLVMLPLAYLSFHFTFYEAGKSLSFLARGGDVWLSRLWAPKSQG